jgi:hypothetical protein
MAVVFLVVIPQRSAGICFRFCCCLFSSRNPKDVISTGRGTHLPPQTISTGTHNPNPRKCHFDRTLSAAEGVVEKSASLPQPASSLFLSSPAGAY